MRRQIGFTWQVGQPLPVALSDLRNDARAALLDMSRGIDPKAKREAAKEAEAQSARSTFAAVAADFISNHVTALRSHRAVEAAFKDELIPVFGKKPIADITDADIASLLKGIAKTRPYQARHVQAYLSKFFRWSIAQRCYGLTVSPCTGLSTNDLIGKANPRDRVLNDGELVSVWRAAASLDDPARSCCF